MSLNLSGILEKLFGASARRAVELEGLAHELRTVRDDETAELASLATALKIDGDELKALLTEMADWAQATATGKVVAALAQPIPGNSRGCHWRDGQAR